MWQVRDLCSPFDKWTIEWWAASWPSRTLRTRPHLWACVTLVLFSIFAHWVIYFTQIVSRQQGQDWQQQSCFHPPSIISIILLIFTIRHKNNSYRNDLFYCVSLLHRLIIRSVFLKAHLGLCAISVFFLWSFRLIRRHLLSTGYNKVLWSLLEHYPCWRCSECLLSRKLSTVLKEDSSHL